MFERGRKCCLLLVLGACSPNASANPVQPASAKTRPCAPSIAPLDSLVHDSTTVTAPPVVRTAGPIEYPEALWKDHVEGIVVLQVWLASTGTVDSTALDSASDMQFVGAAETAVLHGRYWSACVGDKPVRYTALIPVRFVLNRVRRSSGAVR